LDLSVERHIGHPCRVRYGALALAEQRPCGDVVPDDRLLDGTHFREELERVQAGREAAIEAVGDRMGDLAQFLFRCRAHGAFADDRGAGRHRCDDHEAQETGGESELLPQIRLVSQPLEIGRKRQPDGPAGCFRAAWTVTVYEG
jgi:hypothetical protein